MTYTQQKNPTEAKSAVCPECHSKRLLYSKGKLICNDCGHTIGKTYNKYGRKKSEFKGTIYDSKLEANYAEHFDTMLKAGELTTIERQVKISLKAYDKHICNYYIDFVLTYQDGHREYSEIKGYATDIWKMKWKMLEAMLDATDPSATMRVYK